VTFTEHTRFRALKVWKEFRKAIIETRGPYCELCGGEYRGKKVKQLQLHHLDPANYTVLDPIKFKLLCNSCHRHIIERLSKKLRGKNGVKNKEKWLALIEDFLPIS
jgi:hypothetical protein